jgi:peptidoglycan/LPS O-acetylase OafA/YrhL
VVLLPAVLLGFFLDVIGSQYFIEAGLYNNLHDIMRNNFPEHVIIEHLNTGLLFSNLFMLQSFYTETLGSNLPLWSLSFEFWFYCLFGLLMIAVFQKYRWQVWSLILILILLLGSKFLLYFLIWCIGLAVGFLNIKIIKNPFLALLLFMVCLIISRLDLIPIQYFADLLVAMSFGIFLLSMKGIHNSFLCKTEKINSLLAGFSYSLYLIHFPLMLFILSVWVSVFDISNFMSGYQPNSFSMMIYVSTMIIVLILSYGFARVTEYKTVNVRRFLKTRFS